MTRSTVLPSLAALLGVLATATAQTRTPLSAFAAEAALQGIVGPGAFLPSLSLSTYLNVVYTPPSTATVLDSTACVGTATTHEFPGMAPFTVDGTQSATESDILTPFYSQGLPTVSWTATPNKQYTLFLQDFDGGFSHFMAINLFNFTNTGSNVIHPYFGPLNPSTFKNRYTWVLYEQPGPLTINATDMSAWTFDPILGRFGINVSAIATTYGLGNPVGINWQREAVDAWVPWSWHALLTGGTLSPNAMAALSSFNPVALSCNSVYPIKTVRFAVDAGMCSPDYATENPDCAVSYHCIDFGSMTVQGTSGMWIMFQGSFNASTGLAVVNWVDGFKNMGQLSWVYSPSFTTVSSITVITGTLPQPFVSGFTAGAAGDFDPLESCLYMDIWSRPAATVPAFYAFQTPYPGLDYLQTYCVDATGTGYGTYYTRLYEDDNGVATASERGVMNLNYVWNNTVHAGSWASIDGPEYPSWGVQVGKVDQSGNNRMVLMFVTLNSAGKVIYSATEAPFVRVSSATVATASCMQGIMGDIHPTPTPAYARVTDSTTGYKAGIIVLAILAFLLIVVVAVVVVVKSRISVQLPVHTSSSAEPRGSQSVLNPIRG